MLLRVLNENLLLIVVVCFGCLQSFTARNGLISVSGCFCPSNNVTFQCTVPDGIFTVWKVYNSSGSPECEVTLNHESRNITTGCNNAASGQILYEDNNHHTSQFILLVSSDYIGGTVECLVDNGLTEMSINTSKLTLSTGPLPPPSNISLINISKTSDEISFMITWQSPLHNCPVIGYTVILSRCGTCSNVNTTTNSSTITCVDIDLPAICTVSITSYVCGNYTAEGSTESESLIMNLSVPSIPVDVHVCPHYSSENDYLTKLLTIFNKSEPINISTGIDGSAKHYTITYTDFTSGSVCNSAVITASSCESNVCKHDFELLSVSSICPPSTKLNISVTVYATSVLGDGNSSQPVMIDGVNKLVKINMEESHKIVCMLLVSGLKRNNTDYCVANITYGDDCEQSFHVYHYNFTKEKITFGLSNLNSDFKYCIEVTADIDCVIVEREFNVTVTQIQGNKTVNSVLITVILVPVLLFVTIVIVITILTKRFITSRCRKNISKTEELEKKEINIYVCDTKKENMLTFLKDRVHGYTIESGCGYYQLTAPKKIRQDRSIIIQDENGEFNLHKANDLVSDADLQEIDPSQLKTRNNWKNIFIQQRSSNHELDKGVKVLYYAPKTHIPSLVTSNSKIFDVSERCNMAQFGKDRINGYDQSNGYGHYELTEKQHIALTNRIILMGKDERFVTGAYARYYVDAGDGSQAVEPLKSNDQWRHMFIQSTSDNRELLPGSKFLYCEFNE